MFGSAHQQAPEQAIEIIKGGDAFESRAGEKARPLMAFGMFEIEPISAETIIAHMAKPGLGGRLVGNFHSVRTKMGDLLRVGAGGLVIGSRSEEHTSQLQSLMRISYAVFCLKK